MSADRSSSPASGTLLWIGPSRSPELTEPFEFSLRHAAQVACRLDVEDAVRRVAADVQTIILARETRATIDAEPVETLSSRYPHADRLQLLGPAATGLRQDDLNGDWQRMPWHRWRSELAPRLDCSVSVVNNKPCRSVLVIADRFTDAEPLIDLASSTGATVIWSTHATPGTVQNVDAVWWDDSTGKSTSRRCWRERLQPWGSQTRHAWICNSPSPAAFHSALEGGVEVIATKPYSISPLEAMLPAIDVQQVAKSAA